MANLLLSRPQFNLHPEFNLHSEFNMDSEQKTIFFAVIISILLHILIFYLYPYLNLTKPIAMPQSIEVAFSQPLKALQKNPELVVAHAAKGEQTKTPESTQKPQTKPLQTLTSKPLLTTEDSTDSIYLVSPQIVAQVTPQATPLEDTSPSEKATAAYGNLDGEETSTTNIQTNAQAQGEQLTERQTEVASTDEAWDGYGQALYDLVNKGKNYPAIAIRRNWEGDVKLLAEFNSGQLVRVTIITKSVHEPLNDEAMRMVKKAITALAIKGSLAKKTFTVTIPVTFNLSHG